MHVACHTFPAHHNYAAAGIRERYVFKSLSLSLHPDGNPIKRWSLLHWNSARDPLSG